MAAAAIPAAVTAASQAERVAKGLVEGISAAMKEPIVSFRWEPDPKHYGKMRLAEGKVNVTTGLVIGSLLVVGLYEMGAWFAQAISGWNGGTVLTNPLKAYVDFSQANVEYQIAVLEYEAVQAAYDNAYKAAVLLWNDGKITFDADAKRTCAIAQAALDEVYNLEYAVWVAAGRQGAPPVHEHCSPPPYTTPPPTRETAPPPAVKPPPPPSTVMEMVQFRTIGLIDPLLQRGTTYTQKLAPK